MENPILFMKWSVTQQTAVSLFCSNISKKVIFDYIGFFLNRNCLLNNNQPSLKSDDSRIHQLVAITHYIFTAFDTILSLEVYGVFPDLSKGFGRVRDKGLLHKFKHYWIDDK